MSASEKLKGLEHKWDTDPANWDDYGGQLLEALPQIVAVVEAAERIDDPQPGVWKAEDVRAALRALEEALT